MTFVLTLIPYGLVIDNKIKEEKNQLGLENSPTSIYHICGLTPDDKASLAKIDDYIEMLYDDMPQKVRGSGLILKVTCDKDNLEELSSSGNSSVLTANFEITTSLSFRHTKLY